MWRINNTYDVQHVVTAARDVRRDGTRGEGEGTYRMKTSPRVPVELPS